VSKLRWLARSAKKGRKKHNYPATRNAPNPLSDAVSNYFKVNPGVLSRSNRGVIVAEHIKETQPTLTTRKGAEITRNVVNKTINTLGYDKLPKLSITNNPRAVTLIANLLKENPNIKSTAIRNELSKIDPEYSGLSAPTITRYLNRNHPGERQWKTSEQLRAADKIRHEMISAMDDAAGSQGIVALQETISPKFKDILAPGQTLSGAHPALIANRTQGNIPIGQKNYEAMLESGEAIPEAKTFLTTKWRNTQHTQLENQLKKLMDQKNTMASNLDFRNPNSMKSYDAITAEMTGVTDKMSRLGLESKLWNQSKNRYDYFGNLYGSGTNPYFNRSPALSLRESIIDPTVGKGRGYVKGGLVSLLRNKTLQKMARNLIPKQFSILTGGLNV
tara:strand:- start:164 stop:1330 length:1167 start_codon:yes stop_codon:yes gene_type:complete